MRRISEFDLGKMSMPMENSNHSKCTLKCSNIRKCTILKIHITNEMFAFNLALRRTLYISRESETNTRRSSDPLVTIQFIEP